MNLLDIIGEFENRRPRIFLNREHFDTDFDFHQRFRMQESTYEALEEVIGPLLKHETERNHALSPKEQILSCIRFFATNSFYHVLRDAHGPSESTICRCVQRVTSAINDNMFKEYVRFPSDCNKVRQDFYEVAGMPSVCGVVDGTLIDIERPTFHEEQFVDRHGNHSLNVMLICGPNNEFFYCNSSWPGSVNDARVLRNSNIFRASNENFRFFPGSVILGDSIYPCLDWLIPPLLCNPSADVAIESFNRSHRKTRCIIERSIGILKNRFPCLRQKLRVKSATLAAEIVKACVTLHNFCIAKGDSMDPTDAISEQTSTSAETWLSSGLEFQERTERRRQLVDNFRQP